MRRLAFLFLFSSALLSAQAPPPRIGSEIGYGIVQQQCMNCHGKASMPKAAPIPSLRDRSPENIYETLTSGRISAHAGLKLSDEQKQRASESIAGRLLGTAESGDGKRMPNLCTANPPIADPASRPAWNGWGANRDNTRFQPANAAGLTADQVARLKLKWAFGFPAGVSSWGQPTVVSGGVFIGSEIGGMYSLDASSGGVYGAFKTKAGMRNAITRA